MFSAGSDRARLAVVLPCRFSCSSASRPESPPRDRDRGEVTSPAARSLLTMLRLGEILTEETVRPVILGIGQEPFLALRRLSANAILWA